MRGGALVHLPHGLAVDAGGLLDQHVHAVLEAVDGDLGVQEVRHRGDHRVNVARVDHVLPVLVEGVIGVLLLAQLLLGRIDVAQGAKRAVRRALGSRHAGEATLARKEARIGTTLGTDTDEAKPNLVHIVLLIARTGACPAAIASGPKPRRTCYT